MICEHFQYFFCFVGSTNLMAIKLQSALPLENWPMPMFYDADSDETKPPAECTRSASQKEEIDSKSIKTDSDRSATTSFASAWTWTSTTTTTTTTPTPSASTNTYQVPDRYAPHVFNSVHPDAEAWLAHFKRHIAVRDCFTLCYGHHFASDN